MKHKPSILIVEDDPNLGFMLAEHLESNGFGAVVTTNGVDGLEAARKGSFVLCLVDVMLPRKDGFTLTKEMRAGGSNTPVIFLTAKLLKEDRIEGFRSGADDYVTKPFSMEELLLRIHAVLKRTSGSVTSDTAGEVDLGSLNFDTERHVLRKGRKEIQLTEKEGTILLLLAQRRPDVVPRDDILSSVWGDTSIYNSRSLDVFISKLRKHIALDRSLEIRNVHGVGYKLVETRRSKRPPSRH